MHKLTRVKVQELLDYTGHILCVDDLCRIEELDSYAVRVAGTTKAEARLLSEPFELSGVLFYPLTIAKSLWFDEMCDEWELEGTHQEALMFWLLSLPNINGVLDEYSERKKAHRAIKKLSRRLHCSTAEMTDVYTKCVGIKSSGANQEPAVYGGLIECLLREYGGRPDEWLYETPLAMIETLMNAYSARITAEAEASEKAGKGAAPVASERLRSLKDFREKANEIAEGWRDGEA